MKVNSSTSNKFGTLSLNESPVENSIIAQLPYPTESVDLMDKINSLNDEVIRLNNELNYYKKSALMQDKSPVASSKQSLKETKYLSIEQESRISSLANENTKLKQEIAEQREIIRKISQELRSQKRQVKFDEKGMMNEYQRLQLQNDQLRQQNLIYLKDIKELQFQLAQQQLQHKRNTEIIEIQKRELKHRNSDSGEELKFKNMELEYKVADMAQEINEYLKEIDSLNTQIQKMRKQNVIDRQSRLRRNHYQLSPNEGSKSRFRDSSMSRLTELQMMDNERLNLKLAEKNKDYQLLYNKYQALQHNYNELDQNQRDMQRQRKLLEQKISSFEIHTQGDEVVGQLENKLVLMSTELMRLGHLSRTKVQQSNELSLKLKEFILKNEHLQKDLIEKDKIILNYKEELRLMEIRLNEQAQDEEKAREQKESKNKTAKLVKEVQRLTVLYKEKLQALKQSEIKSAILEQKNIRLTKQSEDLQRELKNYMQNADKNKQKATKMLNQQAEINYYKQTNNNLKEEIKRIQTRMYQVRSDAENISRQRDEYRSMNITLQENYVSLQEDLRRMNLKLDGKQVQNRETVHRAEQKLIMKNNEIKRLQQRIKDIEKENQLMSRYRSQLPKYEELIREIQRLEGIQISLKLQISNYEEKVALIAQENERLVSIADSRYQDTATIQRFKQDTQQKDKRIRELSKEVESLTFRQKKYKEENDNLRMKLRQNVLTQRQTSSLEFKNRQLSDELQTSRVQLSVKDEQIRSINERFNREYLEKQMLVRKNEELSSKANITSSLNIDTTTKQYYENQMRKYLQRSKRDGMKIKELMQQTQQQQQIYNTFSSEIMRLNQVISEYTERINLYKKQIDFLQHKVKTCEQTLLQRRTFNQLGSEKSIAEAEIKTKIQIYEGRIRQYQTEVQMYKQRYNSLRESNSTQQSKINSLFLEKSQLEHRVNELQYQLSMKSESFRTVQDSFKLTILEIKSSNERLQQSMRQIQNHYIHKLQLKEQQYENLRREKTRCDQSIHELQKKLSNKEIEYGSEMNEKNRYISTLNNNHNQTKQEVEEIRRIKSQYEIKIALLTQEIQRLNYLTEKQQEQIKAMSRELKQEEVKYVESMKDSSYHNQTLQILSQQIERLNSVILKNVETIKEGQKKAYALQVQNNTLKQQFNQFILKKEETEMKYGQEKQVIMSRCQKAEESIRETKYQLQQKDRDLQRMVDRVRAVEERQRIEVNSQMQHLLEEMRLLRQGNHNLQNKLGLITRQYEHSVSQLEYYKNLKANADQDEKMRIIASYESTIKNMREENTKVFNEKMRFQNQFEKTFQRANQIQERYNISEEKARTYEEKSRRLEQRLRVLEERIRQIDDGTKGILHQKNIIEQKLITAMQQVGRLQVLIKAKQSEIHQLNIEIKQKNNLYNSQEKLADKKGIFIIKEVNELDERSRSASGNNPQPQNRISGNQVMLDLQHRYELLESVNKKLSSENECLRKKGVQYQFKMNKLKEQFDLINRLIHEYRQENDKLKENNKMMNVQLHQKSHQISAHSHLSPQHSSVNTSSYIEKSSFSQKSNVQARNEKDKETSFASIKNKLLEEIDRLSRVNISLQTEVHDLRLNATENVALRKRMEQNMALIVILIVEIESLRLRVREGEMRMLPPLKGPL